MKLKRIINIGIFTIIKWFFKAIFRKIIIKEPKTFQQIGASFWVSGWVPKSWIKDGKRLNNSLSVEYIDLNGKIFAGLSLSVYTYQSRLFEKFFKIYPFNDSLQLTWATAGWIEKSQGRMVLRIYGENKEEAIFIPLIVPQFVPQKPVDYSIIKKHLGVEKKIRKHDKDYKKYIKKLNKLFKKETKEFEKNFTEDDSDWIEIGEDEKLDEIAFMLYSAESDRKRKLDEKYKDLLEWLGPLCRGIAGRMNGYTFKVYSNDHGSHFHVVHRDQKVDARFSFPEIQLINYKNSRNIIGSKEIQQIQEFFKNKENFQRLEEEFNKRKQ